MIQIRVKITFAMLNSKADHLKPRATKTQAQVLPLLPTHPGSSFSSYLHELQL